MEKISANSLRKGNVIIYNNELCVVVKSPEHVKPGKGPAYVQAEMKSVKHGTKFNHRFSSSDYVDKPFIETKKLKYLYIQGDDIITMDENYDQISISKNLLGEKILYLECLTDDLSLEAEIFDSKVINLTLPATLVATVDETEPSIKNATVTSSYKRAVLSNKMSIKVPPYINIGDQIIVKTEDDEFVKRVE